MRGLAVVAVAAVLAGIMPADAGWQAKRKGEVCFAMLTPTASRNAPPGRGKAYLAIMHNRAEGNWDAISFVSGYPDVTKSEPSAEIDGKVFRLLPYKSAAYTRGGDTERDLLKAILEGDKLRVIWKSADGSTTIVDDYDVKGVDAAKATIDQACGRSEAMAQMRAQAQAQAAAVTVYDGNGPKTVEKARNPFN